MEQGKARQGLAVPSSASAEIGVMQITDSGTCSVSTVAEPVSGQVGYAMGLGAIALVVMVARRRGRSA